MRKRRPRLPRYRYIGPHRFFLTVCTLHRQRVFITLDVVDLVRQHILLAADAHDFRILAYCFMPDHLHLLVEGKSAASDMSAFGKLAKQRSSYEFRQRSGERLWQPGWFDCQLQVSDDVEEKIEYILLNPVRAGLVTNASDYPFSGVAVDRQPANTQSAPAATLSGGDVVVPS